MRMAVVGGTGLVGKMVAEAAWDAGHDVVVIARSRGVDVVTGSGLDSALEGVDVVVDVSNVTTTRRKVAVGFFEAETRTLLAAEQRAGVGHHVLLSIVGIDRVGLGYYAGKLRQEELALAGPVPVTVLRATQFHEFAGQLLAQQRGPVVVAPRMRTQPIAAGEVADALVTAAERPPAGRLPDLAGPAVLELADLMRAVLRARGSRRRVLSFRLPGAAGRAMADGGNLPTADGPRGTETFSEWLASERIPVEP